VWAWDLTPQFRLFRQSTGLTTSLARLNHHKIYL
jgi:hypothetical protein